MEQKNSMIADNQLSLDGTIDLTPFFGNWVNCYQETDNIAKVTVEPYQEKQLLLTVMGADQPGAGQQETEPPKSIWTPFPAFPTFDGKTWKGVAFHAQCRFIGGERHIAGQVSRGILIMQTYTLFTDGSDRLNYFSREFFHQ